MLPNLVGIGAQRSATTWLYNCLLQHPDIYLSKSKELHYFSANYSKGLDWYESNFKDVNHEKVIGEISPNYMYYESAIQRIKEKIPDVKLLVLLRNPVERAISAYQLFGDKYAGQTFRQAYESDEGLIDRGMYGKHLTMVLRYFDKSQVKILFYDDILNAPELFLKDVLLYLGVDPAFEFTEIRKRYNRIMYPRIQKIITKLGMNWTIEAVKKTRLGDWVRNKHSRSNVNTKLEISEDDILNLKLLYADDIRLLLNLTGRSSLSKWL